MRLPEHGVDRVSIEWIKHKDVNLGLIIRADYRPDESVFITPETYNQQIGFIVYQKGKSITPHVHKPVERTIRGTSEVLLLRYGHCWVDFYRPDKSLYCSREVRTGDLIILIDGGHGFRMIQDTTFMEVKQGPYLGIEDKERFEISSDD